VAVVSISKTPVGNTPSPPLSTHVYVLCIGDVVILILLVTAVFSSSAQFAQVSGRALPELIQEVTSKGGITFAALKKFEENKLDRLIAEGYQAAYQRNSELQL